MNKAIVVGAMGVAGFAIYSAGYMAGCTRTTNKYISLHKSNAIRAKYLKHKDEPQRVGDYPAVVVIERDGRN